MAFQKIFPYNVIIQVVKNKNVKEFCIHSVILCARAPYFKSALSTTVAGLQKK